MQRPFAHPGSECLRKVYRHSGSPSAHDKGQRAACRNPFTIILTCDMQVSADCRTTDAGGMADRIAGMQVCAWLDRFWRFDVHI